MSLSRRKFVTSTALGATALALSLRGRAGEAVSTGPQILPARGAANAPKRPNLLFLWTDQHRGDTIPYAGNKLIQAPNLERLGERSFCFTRAFCAQPVCTPSRGTVLTGLLPHNHGSIQNNIRLDPKIKCIAEYTPPDYLTGYFGKWHLGDEIVPQHGFKEWRSIEDGIYRKFYSNPETSKLRSSYHHFLARAGFPPDDTRSDPAHMPLFSRNFAAAMAERYTKVRFLADEAVKFLHARRDGQPFLLHVNSLEPHPPTFGPLNELHDPAALPVGPAFGVPVGSDASRLHRRTYDSYQRKGFEYHDLGVDADRRRIRANYYGLVAMVDRAYGRILQALEASGQADNTIVVYTSDHGDMLGDHCLMQKSVFYEPATHVPLMIHVPWLSRQQVRLDQPVSLVDLVPTLLELMGLEPPSGLDGVSRAAALRDPSSWRAGNVVIEWHDADDHAVDGRSLRTADNWKLNLYRGDSPELYDLNTDPGELHNVAREAQHRDRIRRFAEEIQAFQQAHADPMPLQV